MNFSKQTLDALNKATYMLFEEVAPHLDKPNRRRDFLAGGLGETIGRNVVNNQITGELECEVHGKDFLRGVRCAKCDEQERKTDDRPEAQP